jgi:hypothetical protein
MVEVLAYRLVLRLNSGGDYCYIYYVNLTVTARFI